MKLEKRLEHFLKYVDEKTYWKEDNDVPNHVIVRAYLQRYKPTETNTVLVKRERKNVRSEAAVASEGKGTFAEGMGISATFIDGDFNDSYEARIRRSKGRARLRPKGNRD